MQLSELARFVDDVEAAIGFYGALTGREPASAWPGGAVFELGGPTLLVHESYEPGPGELPPEDHVAFAVEDVDAAAERLTAAGFTLERGPADYDWGRSAYFRDPAGNQVELAEG